MKNGATESNWPPKPCIDYAIKSIVDQLKVSCQSKGKVKVRLIASVGRLVLTISIIVYFKLFGII